MNAVELNVEQKAINRFVLWTCCNADVSRYDMFAPFVYSGVIFATDGYRAVAVLAEDSLDIEWQVAGDKWTLRRPAVESELRKAPLGDGDWKAMPTKVLRRFTGPNPDGESRIDDEATTIVDGVCVSVELLFVFTLIPGIQVCGGDKRLWLKWPGGLGVLLARIPREE